MPKKCPNCGACPECGAKPPYAVQPWPYARPQPAPYVQPWPYPYTQPYWTQVSPNTSSGSAGGSWTTNYTAAH